MEGAILSFNVSAVSVLVPVIAKEFGYEEFVIGKIMWIYMLTYGIVALLYGPLIRVVNTKFVEIICLLGFSLANLLVSISHNLISLYLGRFLMGLFGASVIPLVLILIGNLYSEKERGRLVGLFFSTTFIASLIGVFLSGLINWRLIFLIPAIGGFILLFVMILYFPNFSFKESLKKVNYLSILREKRVLCLFSYIFLISALYHGVQQWLGVYFTREFAFSSFWVSVLITLGSLSGILGEVIGGWFSDILGRIKTVKIGILLMIISVFLFIFKVPLYILAFIMVIWGIGWTLNHAGITTILTDLPKEFLNEGASLNSSVRFLSGGVGVMISGLIMQKSFTLGFILIGLSLVGLFYTTNQLILKT